MTVATLTPLVLASSSAIRQQMLKAVGLEFSVAPSGVEEESIKQEMAGAPYAELASALARAKTRSVAKHYPDALTIGADQLCVADNTILNKPHTVEKAQSQLASLSGKTHQQLSAVCIAQGEDVVWEHCDIAMLTMRTLSAEEIAAYIAADQPLHSCGAYKFESLGRHLFSVVEGSGDTIKGLPLVPLLAELHRRSAIALA